MDNNEFACHRGLFQFNVMPFGLTTAPAVFLDKFTVAYLADIIYSATLKEHLAQIQKVFDRLREHSLRLNSRNVDF